MVHKNKSGQALLIILLALVTITTVVLSIVSRSVSEVELTNKEEDSLRAFSAAETGIEQALIVGSIGDTVNQDIEVPTSGGSDSVISNYTTTVSGFPEASNQFAYPYELLSGDSGGVWLVTKDGNTILPCSSTAPCFTPSDMRVCWGATGTGANTATTPAIELSFVYEDPPGSFHTSRALYDPYSARTLGANGNKFETATIGSCVIDGETFAFSKQLNSGDFTSLGMPNVAGQIKLMKVRFLYNTTIAHTFGVSTSGVFPSQGKQVSSTGQAGNATRKIEAYLLNPALPSVFDSAIYSGVSVIK